ncbi:hypothetical protein [Streptomyces sp. NBC_00887]|uniref:hypothetical protein n=1 Tax=Streptomyces sp. NBC_00887 TaxID=2975859 RepID=UPI00386F36E7|nr:hypothetical protein OG844_17180 [Streptomyces sp. NBC_00887]
MKVRLEELAPPGSAERARVDEVTGWAGRGYWDDIEAATAEGRARHEGAAAQSVLVTDAWRRAAHGESDDECGEDLAAAEPAAAVELPRGPRNAPLRLLLARRAPAHVLILALRVRVNYALVPGGTLTYSLWGWLLWIPVLAAEAELRQAKKLGRERVIARMRERHERVDCAA